MKIAVCLKRVPEMELRFSIAGDRKSLDPGGLKYEISDFDGYALEVALQLVEKAGSGEVVAISLGPDGGKTTPRDEVLAMAPDLVGIINQGELRVDAEGEVWSGGQVQTVVRGTLDWPA